jgi:Domain of unknown function (DUF4158)
MEVCMASIHETAYPRLNPNPRRADLEAVFTPTPAELDLTRTVARTEGSRLGFLVMLKIFQRLGHAVYIRNVPPTITEHILRSLGFLFIPATLATYDTSSTRNEHLKLIRAHLEIKSFNLGGETTINDAITRAAQTKEDLRDLINVGLEELANQHFELPGFTTLLKEAQRVRHQVNSGLQRQVHQALNAEECQTLQSLLETPGQIKGQTQWHDVKRDPGQATLKNLKWLMAHHRWLLERRPKVNLALLLPDAKLRQFAICNRSRSARCHRDEKSRTRQAFCFSSR